MAGRGVGVYSFLSVRAAIVGPNISMSFTGAAREGYGAVMDEDKATFLPGADGSGQFSLRASQAGKLTFRLLKTGAMNRALAVMYNYQTASPANYGRNTITLTDSNLGDTIVGQGCGILRMTPLSYGDEGGTNEWVFQCVSLDIKLGNGGITNLVSNG
jgi:hypothetical protein